MIYSWYSIIILYITCGEAYASPIFLIGGEIMRPVLFELFGIKFYGYGLMIAIGIISAMLLFSRMTKKRGYDEDSIFNMTIFAVIAGILGGKLFYIITEFSTLIKNPSSIFKDFGNGFVIYGAVIGGGLAVYIYCRRKGWNFLSIADLAIPTVALAQGFGRIGCFLAGCCYGERTTLPIGVSFPEESLAPHGVELLPTQLISSVFDFCLAALLLWYTRRSNKTGRIFSLYLIIYSIGRFIIEFFRDDPRGNVGPLSTSQFIAIFTLIFGIVIFNKHLLKERVLKSEK